MIKLARHKPHPIPAFHAVPEALAVGQLKESYEDTKAAFGVPWMGVVAMAFASYPTFYGALWEALEPVAKSEAFVQACRTLRLEAEKVAQTLPIGDVEACLLLKGYNDADLKQINQVIEVFSEGNMPYLMMATIARLSLEGHRFEDRGPILMSDLKPTSPVWPHGQPLVLIEQHHQSPDGVALYERIKSALGLPFVNTDYRALARWPSYFTLVWDRLDPHIASNAYTNAVEHIHQTACELCQNLHGLESLSSDALIGAAQADAPAGEVEDVVRLFQWLLPGLVANVAFFRSELTAR